MQHQTVTTRALNQCSQLVVFLIEPLTLSVVTSGPLKWPHVSTCLRYEFLSVQHDSGLKMFVSSRASNVSTPQKFTLQHSFIMHF